MHAKFEADNRFENIDIQRLKIYRSLKLTLATPSCPKKI